MKRPSISIDGRPVPIAGLRAEVGQASANWLKEQRGEKRETAKRLHRALSQEAKEEKAKATAQAAKQRADEREARELERLHRRIGYLSRRSDREAEAMLRVRCSWRSSAEPKVQTICPHSLYSRVHPDVSDRISKLSPSRVAADGFKNIVLRKIARGYGRKSKGTREYHAGEAGDLARYILREDGIEPGITACFTNVLEIEGAHALYETEEFSLDPRRCGQIVGFWKALEAFEAEADADGNVYSHLILAMPHELSPEGRSRALEDFCRRLDALHLPFVAALHHPDAEGDSRNFHAHIIFAPRPFAIEGPYAWSFEAAKATELNLGAGIRWLREEAASAFNYALDQERNVLRYTAVSMAERGVPATGEKHDGPALTAKKRKDQRRQQEREALTRKLVVHVAHADMRQAKLGAMIAAVTSEKHNLPARAPELPPALAAMRERFPDPLLLRFLSRQDFDAFTPADWAADRWYAPAFNLAIEVRRRSSEFVRVQNGEAKLAKEILPAEYRGFVNSEKLPDIVMDALSAAYRQIQQAEIEERKRREKERRRKELMVWLRGSPTLLFDEAMNVLTEHRERFPDDVMALDGIKEAMLASHRTARELERRRITQDEASRISRTAASPKEAADPASKSGASLAQRDVRRQPPTAGAPPPVPIAPEKEEDEAWDLLMRGYQAGKLPTSRGPGSGR